LSDNLNITQGSGTAIAADEVSSVFYQRVKVSWGVDGAAVDASASNPFPVSIIGTVPVSGTFWQATQPVSAASLPLPSGASTSANQSTIITALTAANASLDNIEAAVLDTSTDAPVIVHTPCDVIYVTPTLDTSAYASGDTLFATTAISGAVRANDLRSALQSIAVIDKAKQAPAMRLLFFKAAVTYGTANSAPSLSDSDAVNYLGHVDIAAADYEQGTNNYVACARNIGLLLEAASGTTTVYVAARLTAGTPTFAASDLVLGFGVVHS
jgi:hypothetical protein